MRNIRLFHGVNSLPVIRIRFRHGTHQLNPLVPALHGIRYAVAIASFPPTEAPV